MTLLGHTCTVCGSEDLIVPGLFTVSRETPARAWCRACWPALRASKAVGS